MAEDISFTPKDEAAPTVTAAATERSTDRVDRFKAFIGELFHAKEQKEDDDDDSEVDSSTDKRGRFRRAWQRLFGSSVVQTEKVTAERQDAVQQKSSLFFEVGQLQATAPAESVQYTSADAVTAEQQVDSPLDTTPDVSEQQTSNAGEQPVTQTQTNERSVPRSNEQTDVLAESQQEQPEQVEVNNSPTDNQEQQQPHADNLREDALQQQIYQERYETTENTQTTPTRQETVYYGGGLTATEKARLWRAEQQASKAKKEARRAVVQGQAKKQTAKVPEGRVNSVVPQEKRENTQQISTSTERLVTRVERLGNEKQRSAGREVTRRVLERPTEKLPSVQRVEQAADRAPQQHPEKVVFTKEVVQEKLYGVSKEVKEVVEKLEQAEVNEISYELSHEHKDLDKQAANQWAQLQQQAEEQAKAAAAALAQAQKSVAASSSALQTQVKKQAPAHVLQSYTQALIAGVTTAIILFAIILVILLIK